MTYLVYFTVIGNILWPFGILWSCVIFFPVLVFYKKTNLATLALTGYDAVNLGVS
jgi:hypothetical protein